MYQYQDRYEDSTCEIPVKRRKKTDDPTALQFSASESHLSLKDRRQARALSPNIPLVSYEPEAELNDILLDDDNFVWSMTRIHAEQDGIKPISWNKFVELICDPKPTTAIAYGPTFPESPTKPDVVQASLYYFIKVTEKLGQENTIVTCDQAIYNIVKRFVAKYPEKYRHLIVHMGGFHTIENFLSSIGFFMQGSGIEDILVKSEICMPGTENKIVSGKDHCKMLRYYLLVCEAMMELKWNAFQHWSDSVS